ncbi:hypothetical protein [Fontibacillus sp. BL9]|uniref:hypothetical protein n=1 Tax=Fontibacillus sp. BL9 TaxID=3389971 RepID=UPI003977F9DB
MRKDINFTPFKTIRSYFHVILSEVNHFSVYNCCNQLMIEGAELTFLGVDETRWCKNAAFLNETDRAPGKYCESASFVGAYGVNLAYTMKNDVLLHQVSSFGHLHK